MPKDTLCCGSQLNLRYLAINSEMLYYETRIPGDTYLSRSAVTVLFFLNKYTLAERAARRVKMSVVLLGSLVH